MPPSRKRARRGVGGALPVAHGLPMELWVEIVSYVAASYSVLLSTRAVLPLRLCSRDMMSIVGTVLQQRYRRTHDLFAVQPRGVPRPPPGWYYFEHLPVRMTADFIDNVRLTIDDGRGDDDAAATDAAPPLRRRLRTALQRRPRLRQATAAATARTADDMDAVAAMTPATPTAETTWPWLMECARPAELNMHLQYQPPDVLRAVLAPLVTSQYQTLQRLSFCHLTVDLDWFVDAAAGSADTATTAAPLLQSLEFVEAIVHWTKPVWRLRAKLLHMHRSVLCVGQAAVSLPHVEELKLVQTSVQRMGSFAIELDAPELQSLVWTGHSSQDALQRSGPQWHISLGLHAPRLQTLKLSLLDHRVQLKIKPMPNLNLKTVAVGSSFGIKFPWTCALSSGAKELVGVFEDSVVPAMQHTWAVASASHSVPTVERMFLSSRFSPVPWRKLSRKLLANLRELHLQGFEWAAPVSAVELPNLKTVWIQEEGTFFAESLHLSSPFRKMIEALVDLPSKPKVMVLLPEYVKKSRWDWHPEGVTLVEFKERSQCEGFNDGDWFGTHMHDLNADVVSSLRLMEQAADDDDDW